MTKNTYEPASEEQRKRLIPSLEKYLAWECKHGASQTQPADGSRHVVELAIVELQRLTAENERLRSQVYQFQARILEKMAQVRAETALRAGAEKRLADIVEILEPFDPPENYAVVVDKIATLANPERYACDPIDTTHTGNAAEKN